MNIIKKWTKCFLGRKIFAHRLLIMGHRHEHTQVNSHSTFPLCSCFAYKRVNLLFRPVVRPSHVELCWWLSVYTTRVSGKEASPPTFLPRFQTCFSKSLLFLAAFLCNHACRSLVCRTYEKRRQRQIFRFLLSMRKCSHLLGVLHEQYILQQQLSDDLYARNEGN